MKNLKNNWLKLTILFYALCYYRLEKAKRANAGKKRYQATDKLEKVSRKQVITEYTGLPIAIIMMVWAFLVIKYNWSGDTLKISFLIYSYIFLQTMIYIITLFFKKIIFTNILWSNCYKYRGISLKKKFWKYYRGEWVLHFLLFITFSMILFSGLE